VGNVSDVWREREYDLRRSGKKVVKMKIIKRRKGGKLRERKRLRCLVLEGLDGEGPNAFAFGVFGRYLIFFYFNCCWACYVSDFLSLHFL